MLENEWLFWSPLTLCIRETPKRVLLQTVKTQMKCSIMLHFIRVYTVWKAKKDLQTKEYNFYAPAIYNGGGGIIASPLYVRTYLRTSRTYKNGFRAISFENIGVLDSYFIHRFIIIKYRSSSIMDKIHQLSELWPLISNEKWFPGDIFWIQLCIGFIFHTQVYNHKIQVKFDYG